MKRVRISSRGNRLVVFLKEPRLGRVKRRLAAEVGEAAALAFYRRSAAAILRLGRDPRWQTVVALTPDRAIFRAGLRGIAPPGIEAVAQGQGDLGRRMANVFRKLAPAIIIGSDIPGVRADHIARAFRALRGVDAVFGPAKDGGFWLVGLRRAAMAKRLFSQVRWSGPFAMADVRENLPAGARVALIDTLEDVDDGASYRRFLEGAGRR